MGQRSSVAVSCGVGCRRGLDPALLWLWCRPAAVALIQPLAWEPLYVLGVQKRSKTKKTKQNKTKQKNSPKRALFFVCLLGVFWPQLQHMGVLTPRIESELQLGCKSNNAGSLTYDCAVPGMELTLQQ